MSRWAIGFAAIFLAFVLAGDGFAKGGHGGGRGGGHGGGKHGFSRGHGGGHHHFRGHRGGFSRHAVGRAHFGGPRHAARHQNFGQMRHAALVPGRNAMNLLSRPGALRNGKLLASPMARAQLTAAAALAGWHGGAVANGWWRHGNGGYGWVGPLFWPFAYNDIYDYAIWDDGLGFWGYGYPDIYAGIFPPYGYGDLAGYFPQQRYDRRRGRPIAIGAMCGNDSRAVAGMPIDQIADAVQPTDPPDRRAFSGNNENRKALHPETDPESSSRNGRAAPYRKGGTRVVLNEHSMMGTFGHHRGRCARAARLRSVNVTGGPHIIVAARSRQVASSAGFSLRRARKGVKSRSEATSKGCGEATRRTPWIASCGRRVSRRARRRLAPNTSR